MNLTTTTDERDEGLNLTTNERLNLTTTDESLNLTKTKLN